MKNKLTDIIDKIKYQIKLLNGQEEYNIMIDIFKSYYKLNVYKGKTILDIGADFGLSSKFFIDKGATKVIAYSPLRQKEWLINPKIEWHKELWKGDYINADIIKIDCESCEYQHIIEWYFEKYNEMFFTIHYNANHSYEFYHNVKYLEDKGAVKLLDYGLNEKLYYWNKYPHKGIDTYD